jgi:hypothetical protein
MNAAFLLLMFFCCGAPLLALAGLVWLIVYLSRPPAPTVREEFPFLYDAGYCQEPPPEPEPPPPPEPQPPRKRW